MSADYWRQLDLITPSELAFPVTIIGAGGIGSPTALALVKMGCRDLRLYDDDRVEPHNLPNQLYRLGDLGLPKVTALAAILREFTDGSVVAVERRVGTEDLRGVVVSAVDSMESRRSIWLGSIRYRTGITLYVDARMGADVIRVLSVRPTDPDHVRFYEATLYSDDEAVDEPCTAQAVIYSSFGVAALIANQVKRFGHAEHNPREILFDFATLSLLASTGPAPAPRLPEREP